MPNSFNVAGRQVFTLILMLLTAMVAAVVVRLAPPAGPDSIRDAASRASSRAAAKSREPGRLAHIRRLFTDIKGRDPAGLDEASLRRWVDSPLGTAEVASRLRNERPQVGIYYYTWYRNNDGRWGNNATAVPPDAPTPILGRYDSIDPDIMAAHISQMTAAGVDFVIVNLTVELPESWARAAQFFNRLRGSRLKAAVMLDGLYDASPAEKEEWALKAVREFTAHPNHFLLHGKPLLAFFSASIDFRVPGVQLRNVYWTPRYAPGENTFNPQFVLHPHDWPFWAPTPQPAVNGMVPVIPGYGDTHLGRERRMEFPRHDGRMYHAQWQRALALRPELIIVYSWNEHFERAAIEPTDAWGDRYVRLTACYAAHARRGTIGPCEGADDRPLMSQ